ncbi:MAG: trypsin-like peptidase domain-containing protein [Chloroflexota bacterium]
MKKRHTGILSILLSVLFLFGGCADNTTGAPPAPVAAPAPASVPAPSSPLSVSTLASVADLQTTLENVYAEVNPSVVNISVIQRQDSSTFNFPQIPGLPMPGPQGPQGPQFSRSLGSGFVWDSAGHIVTNNHVVANADNISVTFSDGTILRGEMIGTDADSDLAVVKVDLSSVRVNPVQMADSTQLKVGQLAIAIGNPFGLQGTMTLGIISGLGRLVPANENPVGPSYSIPDIIQTDAAVNPGNSGGVLLDIAGRVIGVTSSIVTTTGTSAGVGFAIPSTIVQQVVPALIQTGRYAHPYLGVSIISLTPDISTAINLAANQRGAMVAEVTAGGPADRAGIRAGQDQVSVNGRDIPVGGDVIIAYNGQTVKSTDDLITILARSGAVGETVTLTVLRNGEQVQVPVTLGTRPIS